MFDPQVWEAAQLTTRSNDGVRGTIEALSTLHRPFGLMQDLVEDAATAGRTLVRWCLLDVIERCPAERSCESCALWDDCRGVAKERGDGFFKIDDAIAMKARVSQDVWASEMLCRRPSVRGLVFGMFDAVAHVQSDPPFALDHACEWWLAMDFGYSAPFACLWIAKRGEDYFIVDEYLQDQRTLAQHVAEVKSRRWPPTHRVACDPAGNGRNDQTAKSNVDLLRASGFTVRTKPSHIVDGIELIRAALRSATGQTRLRIHPRCAKLIRALQSYHYATARSEMPDKDGTHDHPIDALRYFFINHQTGRTALRNY